MKRQQLKQQEPDKPKRMHLKGKSVHFSGFCATDNKNFALFDVNRKFLIDRGFTDVLPFTLTEHELWMLIDRKQSLKYTQIKNKVLFHDYGLVDKKHFQLLLSHTPECVFYPVTEWFGKASNRLVVALPDQFGKPVGILKTIQRGGK